MLKKDVKRVKDKESHSTCREKVINRNYFKATLLWRCLHFISNSPLANCKVKLWKKASQGRLWVGKEEIPPNLREEKRKELLTNCCHCKTDTLYFVDATCTSSTNKCTCNMHFLDNLPLTKWLPWKDDYCINGGKALVTKSQPSSIKVLQDKRRWYVQWNGQQVWSYKMKV